MNFNDAISTVASFLKDRDDAFIMTEEQTDTERRYSAEILVDLLGLRAPLPISQEPDVILNLWEGSDKIGTNAETVNFATDERGRLELFTRARVEALLATASLSVGSTSEVPVEGLETKAYVWKTKDADWRFEEPFFRSVDQWRASDDHYDHDDLCLKSQAEGIIVAERTKLEATAKAGLLISAEIDRLKADNAALTLERDATNALLDDAIKGCEEHVAKIEALETQIATAACQQPGIDLVLVRTASETPVPSHGGPAVSVTWELSLNGVVIESSRERYHWSERDKAGLKAPSQMQRLLVDLQAAIDSPTKPQEVADVQE